MKKPNFFAGVEALNHLLQMEYDDMLLGTNNDLTLDVIEIPNWLSLHCTKKTKTVKLYSQGELYSKDEKMAIEEGSITVDLKSGKTTVKSTKEMADTLTLLFKACLALSCFIADKGLDEVCKKLAFEKEGILLTVENDEITWKVVSGKERPDLMCMKMGASFFEPMQPVMMRPYMDDFWQRSMIDGMDIEEKLDAANDGNEFAIAQVAVAYLNGDGVEQDPEKAAFWYEKLDGLGDPEAAFNLGLMYAKGHGVERDFIKASEYMEKARDRGDADANDLIEKYRTYAKDKENAEKGDPQGQADYAADLAAMLGTLEQADMNVDADLAFDYAQKAINAGIGDGYYALGVMVNLQDDKKSVFETYKKGADMGGAKCIGMVGKAYLLGEGVEADNKLGFRYSLEAAEKGVAFAMVNVARCYQFAIGVKGNMKTATEWYGKALEAEYDPGLERRVDTFRQMSEIDPDWGNDYEESEETLKEHMSASQDLANGFSEFDPDDEEEYGGDEDEDQEND